MYEIKHIDNQSLGRVFLALSGIGALLHLLIAIFAGAFLYTLIIMVFILPLSYFIGRITAIIFNYSAKKWGGLKIQLNKVVEIKEERFPVNDLYSQSLEGTNE